MSIQPIGNSPTSASQKPQASQAPAEELTTVTTKCDKKHMHDQNCPHTVSTRPAPKIGESGYLFDETV